MQSVLLVENKKEIDRLSLILAKNRFKSIRKVCEEEAITVIQNEIIHLVILDQMVSPFDWIETCKKVRDYSNVPIIFLTECFDKESIIKGLDNGADDFMVKPIDDDVFLAKVKAILRRGDIRNTQKSNVKGLVIDRDTCEVRYQDQVVNTTRIEYLLIDYFLSNRNKVFTREELISQVWEYEYTETRTVDSHIRNIRDKLRHSDFPVDTYLLTVRGFGYRWSD
ncbi:response regulator transcription factor [Metabacillus herbersteinensis]|uniref:Response regulator transcription factor n=2 Tax=Metabacillus herbersteinensis TaxID=283816 RepID=A0ABV6GMI2_9BACI